MKLFLTILLSVLALPRSQAQSAARTIGVFTNVNEMLSWQPSNVRRWVFLETNDVVGLRGSLFRYDLAGAASTNLTDTFTLLSPNTGQYLRVDSLDNSLAEDLTGTTPTVDWTQTIVKRWTLASDSTPHFVNVPHGTNWDAVRLDVIQPGGASNAIAWTDGLPAVNWGTSQNYNLPLPDTTNHFTLYWNGRAMYGINEGQYSVSATNIIGGDTVWTNDVGVIRPAVTNLNVTVTNFISYGTLTLPAKIQALVLGTNELDMSTQSTWLLNSPTNDSAQVILSLSAGAFQGQLAFITSQNDAGAFILPDLSEQYDVAGAYVDLQGDWIGTTNRGIILQYTAPDWIEMDRFDPSSTNGPFASGGTTINPTDGHEPYRIDGTTFGDSPWYYISTNQMGFYSTNKFLQLLPGSFFGVPFPSLTFGFDAGNALVSSSIANTAIGYQAIYRSSNSFNTALGHKAGSGLTSGASNVALGEEAMGNDGTAGTGSYNVAVGVSALLDVTSGEQNTGVGYEAAKHNTTGSNNTALGSGAYGGNSGSYNVAIGRGSMIGTATGGSNTMVGAFSGDLIQAGMYNTGIGVYSGPTTSALTNTVSIGAFVRVADSNIAQIGTNGVSVLYLNGTVGWFRGSGSPEGAVTAPGGSFYSDESGYKMYVKESASGNTGWALK